MNPNYSGRTELPDNLKSLFRPVSMIIPDSMLISEILLYSYGFFEAKSLAQKIVYTFYLAKQQLSQQVHYDFGLRAIKIILSSAGVLKLKASGIVDLGAKFTDDFKSREEFAEKERRLDPSFIDEEDGEEFGISGSKKRSRQFKLKHKASTKDFKMFKKMKKSLHRKETKRMQKEAKEAAEALKAKEEDQKGIHFSESSLSSKDILNKDDISISSLDSEDIIYNDQEVDEKHRKIKEMITQLYKGESKDLPIKDTQISLATKLEFISDKKKGKIASEQLIDELGLESAEMLTDDKKIEEFIVLRAIKDTNLSKFHDTDTLIFESI